MKTNLKIYVTGAVLLVIVIGSITGWVWSNHKIANLEREVDAAKSIAADKQTTADEKERQAGEYKAKNEYLEATLTEIRNVARKQDDELETLTNTTNSARADVERSRRVRSVAANADELCAKLAEVGHGCE